MELVLGRHRAVACGFAGLFVLLDGDSGVLPIGQRTSAR